MKAPTLSQRWSPQALRLFFAGLLVAAAGMFTLTAFAQGMPHHGPGGPGGHDGMFFGPLGGRGLDRMLDSVKATDAQRTQIKQIAQAAVADLKAQHEARKGLHDQAVAIFTAPTVDAAAAETLRQQMLAQHDQASKRMLQAMLDISRVLTPEQRQQLAQKMQQRHEMMERHMHERQQPESK
jgi:Spy/CpxP family protein refolding chaperone